MSRFQPSSTPPGRRAFVPGRRPWVTLRPAVFILLAGLAGGAGAAAFDVFTPREYRAVTQLTLDPRALGPESPEMAMALAHIRLGEGVSGQPLDISRAPGSPVVALTATAATVDAALDLAGTAARNFVEAEARLAAERRSSLESQAHAAQARLHAAEAALARLEAQSRSRDDATGELIDAAAVGQLEEQAGIAATRAENLRRQVDALRMANVESLAQGGIPAGVDSPVLKSALARYTEAVRELTRLGRIYGPRHPRHIDATAVVRRTREGVVTELPRAVTAAEAELATAEREAKTVSTRIATWQARLAQIAPPAESRNLQRNLQEAQGEADRLAGAVAASNADAGAAPVRILTPPAVLPEAKILSRQALIMLGAAAGLLLGLVLELAVAFIRFASRSGKGPSAPGSIVHTEVAPPLRPAIIPDAPSEPARVEEAEIAPVVVIAEKGQETTPAAETVTETDSRPDGHLPQNKTDDAQEAMRQLAAAVEAAETGRTPGQREEPEPAPTEAGERRERLRRELRELAARRTAGSEALSPGPRRLTVAELHKRSQAGKKAE